ncbi:capsule polysaccharide transporter [Bacteroidia bacterium]|nr:capsule polysaccharide transporter [Bacteroidia bacterium]
MKKGLLLIYLVLSVFSSMVLAQAVPDSKVVQMIRGAQAQGMSQQQIAAMLASQGVTKAQLSRVKRTFNNEPDQSLETQVDRLRSTGGGKDAKSKEQTKKGLRGSKKVEGDPQTVMQNLYRVGVLNDLPDTASISWMFPKKSKIFGRDIFSGGDLTFAPQEDIATPMNYIIGPGDEVIIDIWGDAEDMIQRTISPDGKVVIDGVGPVSLSGLTIKDATRRLKSALGRKSYAGLNNGSVSLSLTLGRIRSINVNVIGEVSVPGTYTLSSLSTVFHALYNAGGINDIGSLRSIKVYRQGKSIADIDVYDYLFEGKVDIDITLQDGDAVVVSPYVNIVDISGKVKRPMMYELRDDETLSHLLRYAGNFAGDAYKSSIRVIRKSGKEHQVYNVETEHFVDFILTDGDEVTIDAILPRFENKVEIQGAVFRAGLYAITDDVKTVKQLIDKANGLREDAFLSRAVLHREQADLSSEVISVDVAGLLKGQVEDIPLYKNDVLYIPSIFELREEYTVTLEGAVKNPDVYKYADNMTVEDLIIMGGGLMESASIIKIDIFRRFKDPQSKAPNKTHVEMLSVDVQDGLILSGNKSFSLSPFDEVHVRESPAYRVQQNVSIEGEAMFAGEYALSIRNERLSDIVKKAGGLSKEAYPEGARLLRVTTPEQKVLMQEILMDFQMKSGGKDTLLLGAMGDYHSVGIELQEALKSPGSDFDVVLKEGDRLIIPQYNGAVGVHGAVGRTNTVAYKSGKRVRYYVRQAGGYSEIAKKSNVFVLHMNGTIEQGRWAKVKPGSEIIVPTKIPTPSRLGEYISIATSVTSVATMMATLITVLNR